MLSVLRSKTTTPPEFRRHLQQISILLLAHASARWETEPREIETPLARAPGQKLKRPVVFVPILRAGQAMVDGMSRVLPEAGVGHIGIYRDEKTLMPTTYFSRLPEKFVTEQVLLLDPMLATGGSAVAALQALKARSATRIQFICLVACPEGIAKVSEAHPDVEIICAAVDPGLDHRGYILPGLGDAGDRYFGTA
jgi:uracil phosphoribosyltransferase